MKIDKHEGADGGQAPVSPLVFRLDSHSGVPTYLQLVHQVEQALRLGYLRRGDQLPRVKDVVASLAINPNTVLKAYRELEHKGLAGGRPGQGTFVQATPRTVDAEELAALRDGLVSGWLAEAAAAGLDDEGITALFLSALRDFHERRDARAHPRGGRPRRPARGKVVA
jgi:DNA-binding transcriptional regulator YhcF (GntR family)